MDEEVADVYRGRKRRRETVVMCQLFMDLYRARFLIGTNRFHLDAESVEDYILL